MYKENLSVKCLSKHCKYLIILTASYYTQSCTRNIFPLYPEVRTPGNVDMWASLYKRVDGHIQFIYRRQDIAWHGTANDIQCFFSLFFYSLTHRCCALYIKMLIDIAAARCCTVRNSLINMRQHKKNWNRDCTFGIHKVTCWTPEGSCFDSRQW